MQAYLKTISTLVWVGGAFFVVQGFAGDTNTPTDQILPTFADVSYGPHPRNIFDQGSNGEKKVRHSGGEQTVTLLDFIDHQFAEASKR